MNGIQLMLALALCLPVAAMAALEFGRAGAVTARNGPLAADHDAADARADHALARACGSTGRSPRTPAPR